MQNSSRQMMWSTVMLVLLLRVGSSSMCFLMILIAGSVGMEVNSALTSYDMMHSSGWSFIFLILSRNSLLFCTWWEDLPTRGLMIFASSFAVSYVADPLLDIIGLNGTSALWIFGSL